MCTAQKPKKQFDYKAYIEGRLAGKYVVIYKEDTQSIASKDEIQAVQDAIAAVSDSNDIATTIIQNDVAIASKCFDPDESHRFKPADAMVHSAEILTITASLFGAKVLSIANSVIAKGNITAESSRAGPLHVLHD